MRHRLMRLSISLFAENSNKLVKPPARAVIAIPANNIVATDVPVWLVARRYTRKTAQTPPVNAPNEINDKPAMLFNVLVSWAPNTIIKPAPAEAPAVTPISDGSASGLRNSPCVIAPQTASMEPISAASSARGNRIWLTINWFLFVVLF